jgi:predicted Zn-dependent protease
MASFFEVMSRLQPSNPNMRMPEFLRTHPVTTARISEARTRAREYERRMPSDSTNYGIARARVTIQAFDTDEEAIIHVEDRAYENQTDVQRYARAVAYQRVGRNLEAMRIYEELAAKDQKVIAYHIGLGETQLALEMLDRGVNTFERAVRLFPRNVPLVIHYGELLVRLGRAKEAHDMLLDLMNNVPPTPEQVRLLARAANAAGEMAEAYYYMSEYRLMTGDLVGGISFLREALGVPEIKEIQRIRFEARIDFIREFMTEEQLQQMQRSRPTGTSARNAP